MEVRSKSVLTVQSPTAYRLHVDTIEDGVAGQEDMVARRIGECREVVRHARPPLLPGCPGAGRSAAGGRRTIHTRRPP